MTTPGVEQQSLGQIVGQKLNSVTFVMDYVQLEFDDARLTAFTQPYLVPDKTILRWDDPGYRDTLCGQIGRKVSSVAIRGGDAIEVAFETGIVVGISLKDQDYRGAEAAMFNGRDHGWWVL